jgi:hypothetical protein
MGVQDVIKAKIPAFPKEITDKNLAGEFKKWEKSYADLQAAAKEFGYKIGTATQVFGTVPDACQKLISDKKTDPKQAKALEALYKTVSQLEMLVGKMC